MKKSIFVVLLLAAATIANAIPAKREWRTVTQPDGTTLEVQVVGDEFYHFMINRDGQQIVRTTEGMYQVAGDAPAAETIRARRAQAQARRARKAVGVTPNLAPRGVVILANFTDLEMKEAHTLEVFDELCNSTNCTVNGGYPSAAQYFADQSNGSYRPQFDVFGPVTLSNNYAYYGANDANDNDQFATDAVIEACILANQQYSDLNFKNYDSDNDGYVDFVYVIYAGYGESETYSFNTDYIWPHNYEIQEIIKYAQYGYSKYSKAQTKLDGVYLNNYAMSNERDYYGTRDALGGIGTLCHEFGHVIGLPDFYDTNSNSGETYNSSNYLTPNMWDVMDAGAYNGKSHCPPYYSPWEKYFFGWHTPINLGNDGQLLELIANGKEGYQAYQINSSGNQQTATSPGLCYYIENRQQQGWDKNVPGHGMLIWKVNFSSSKWTNNTPNNTDNNPLYTIVSAYGTQIGNSSNGKNNTFPGNMKVTSWSDVSGKPLLDIKETSGVVTLTYIEEPVDPKFIVTWVVDGVKLETVEYAIDGSEDLRLPTKTVTPCEGTELIGWTTETQWLDPFAEPEDLFTTPSGKVTADVTYHALFK